MTIKDISKIIYEPGTTSEDTECLVQHIIYEDVKWSGPAKQLPACPFKTFEIVEIKRLSDLTTPIYNCPWYITVI